MVFKAVHLFFHRVRLRAFGGSLSSFREPCGDLFVTSAECIMYFYLLLPPSPIFVSSILALKAKGNKLKSHILKWKFYSSTSA
ncbi:hypothetical protein COCMIDRAFT_98335 [Bipolaris oryzae ATCC 44560]|uniref:Uncharacterized protein n=1 Tax=Bipolaris oryzae ATCC 44560 TaxID=930090 RepID=W6ZLB8_COCMI|nr:uncharacterized protein COCMIDRAFT_98335 [Bipolaris oryzae ATCC 44560]EUC44386.1 hypothetical protein COCMIDRAFT_98335 [Bipolaris oryzae ATCC 44560]